MHLFAELILCNVNPLNSSKGVVLTNSKKIITMPIYECDDIVNKVKELFHQKYEIDISWLIPKLIGLRFKDGSIIATYTGIIPLENLGKKLYVSQITELLTLEKLSKEDKNNVQKAISMV